jgi:hypothetical protein
MNGNDKKKKISPEIRRDIRRRAKVESGRKGAEATQGTKAGGFIRKTFTESKTGVKKVGLGTRRGSKDPNRPEKPKMEEVQVQAKRFESREGETGRSKTYTAKTPSEFKRRTVAAQKEAGAQKDTKSKSDVGKKEFKSNLEKQSAYKKESSEAKYKKGERTDLQKEKSEGLRRARTKYIKEAGGKIRKGERRLEKHIKGKLKKKAREGTYKKY